MYIININMSYKISKRDHNVAKTRHFISINKAVRPIMT